MRSLVTAGLILVFAACLSLPHLTNAAPPSPVLTDAQRTHMLTVYGRELAPILLRRDVGPGIHVRRQGRDSNCDFIAATNDVAAIGGNGDEAYARSRTLIAQAPVDYREGFYTVLGPSGSDKPFSLDNLGAAPEAFIGVYEALGYDTILLAAPPDQVNHDFARAVRDQLAAAPTTSFAHLWITPRPYNPRARTLTVPATGERASLLYPYHEVAAIVDPQAPERLILLDGLIGYPVSVALDDLAHQLRGFNKVIVVRKSGLSEKEHLTAQLSGSAQPYAVVGLGGAFLTTARQLWGPSYTQWGRVSGPPLRLHNGTEMVVRLPGEYVLYERGSAGVTLVNLGSWMRDSLAAQNVLRFEQLRATELRNGLRDWAVSHAGSLERFHALYGATLTEEVWMTPETFRSAVLRGAAHPLAHAPTSGYVVVITEGAMLAWSPEQGTTLVPLGLIYLREMRADLGV